jgi:DNA-binding HxlR family transcriptional regulator
MGKDHTDHSICASYEKAADLLGKRWTGMMLRVLLEGPQRFGELSSKLPAISERVLSERLKELEGEGVVDRRVDPGPPVRVEYRLTEKGQGLSKVVEELGKWATRWVGEKAPRAQRSGGTR